MSAASRTGSQGWLPESRGGGCRVTSTRDRLSIRFGDMVLAEKEQEYSGLSFDESAAALARRAGAALAVSGSVRRDGEGYLITVRLLDPAGGGLIAAETARAGGDYLFREASRAAAAALASR